MKFSVRIVLIMLIITLPNSLIFGADPRKMSPDELYTIWEDINPQLAYDVAFSGAMYISKMTIEEIRNEFNGVMGTLWTQDKQVPHLQVISCENDVFVAQPYPEMKELYKVKNWVSGYVDAKGRASARDLCNEIKKHPKGYIIEQYQHWFNATEPITNFVYIFQVPGRKLQILTNFVSKTHNAEELNAMIPKWFDEAQKKFDRLK